MARSVTAFISLTWLRRRKEEAAAVARHRPLPPSDRRPFRRHAAADTCSASARLPPSPPGAASVAADAEGVRPAHIPAAPVPAPASSTAAA